MKLDRSALNSCLEFHSRQELADMCEVSLPTFRKYLRGTEPRKRMVTQNINTMTSTLLRARKKIK